MDIFLFFLESVVSVRLTVQSVDLSCLSPLHHFFTGYGSD